MPETTVTDITYGAPSFGNYLDNLTSEAHDTSGAHHLSLFLGVYEANKKKALIKIREATGSTVEEFDFKDLVFRNESDTYANLDRLFEDLADRDSVLYFANGDRLCGSYSNHSHSKVKYATPQERHFLDKVKSYGGLVIVDISDWDSADKTIQRAAQSIVRFPLPKSRLKRFFWHLKHYSLHGYDIKTKRPSNYDSSSQTV